jgi:hypothetical protein
VGIFVIAHPFSGGTGLPFFSDSQVNIGDEEGKRKPKRIVFQLDFLLVHGTRVFSASKDKCTNR